MRPTLLCRRPAVSMMTTSTSSSMPALTASKATAAGSAPSLSERTVATPTRAPHVSSWSAAAARKVSAAPSSTSRSSATRTRASLPTVVVLPVPLTPTTRMTAGRSPIRLLAMRRSMSGWTSASRSSRSQPRTVASSVVPVDLDAGAQRVDELGGGLDAEVGGDEGVLDLLPGLLVELAAREQREQALADGGVGPGQARAQPLEPAAGRLRPLEGRLGDGRSARSEPRARASSWSPLPRGARRCRWSRWVGGGRGPRRAAPGGPAGPRARRCGRGRARG